MRVLSFLSRAAFSPVVVASLAGALALPAQAQSARYEPAGQTLFMTDIQVEGHNALYQDVRIKLDDLGQITLNDDRVYRFHFDPHTAVLTLPSVVVGETAYAGVRLEGVRFSQAQAGGMTAPSVRAFPGALGFGATATGGRGGRVITVTNLNASGPGSLQDALDQTGPRTVVFAVSGLIDAAVHLTHGDVTIAGQTAPAGIAVRQFHTTETPFCDQDLTCIHSSRRADNWILRHMRLRPDGEYDDGLRLRYTRHAIVDQVSIGGATDEAVEISYSNNVTLQNTLIAETLGSHAELGGVLVNYSNPAHGYALTRLTLYGNTFNRILGRYPELSREGRHLAGEVMDIEISNNLYWDMGYFIDVNNSSISASDEGEPIYYRLNLAENHAVVRRPDQPEPFPYGFIHIARPLGPTPQTSTWFSGNRMNLYPDRRDYALLYCCNDYAQHTPDTALPAFARPQRHDFPVLPLANAQDLPALAFLRAGAFPRDPMDMRLMGAVSAREIALVPRHVNPVGDGRFLPEIALPAVVVADSDGDGMPDDWERRHGLNPHSPSHNGLELSLRFFGVEGYTNLEVYLQLLSEQRIREQAMRGL